MKISHFRLKAYFPALTGLRAIAAIMVVVLHMAQRIPRAPLPFISQIGVEYMLQWHTGVVIFFVLSGFLITTRYASQIELSGS